MNGTGAPAHFGNYAGPANPGQYLYEDLVQFHWTTARSVFTLQRDSFSQSVSLYSSKMQVFMPYGDPTSAKARATYVSHKGMAGMEIFDISGDTSNNPLVLAISSTLNALQRRNTQALRMSLEEERARQAATAAPAAAPSLETVPESATPAEGSAVPTPAAVPSTPAPAPAVALDAAEQAAILGGAQIEDVGMGGADEEADLALALALSKGDDVEMAEEEEAGDEDDEDAEMARAIALSMKEAEENDK